MRILGGEGVGRVTKPGLDQPVGEAAINHVPRQMIAEALEREAENAAYTGGFAVTISVEGGAETAKRTFNPHIGVEGGLSILGTSGIVEPMSQQAILDTIQLEMNQAALRAKNAPGPRRLVLAPGNYGWIIWPALCRSSSGSRWSKLPTSSGIRWIWLPRPNLRKCFW